MLPSDYISTTALYVDVTYPYIDTGVVAKSTMSFELSFGCDVLSSNVGYVFGARETNSNTSACQMNFFLGKGASASYYGYNSARVSKTTKASSVNGNERYHLSAVSNDCTLVVSNAYTYEFLGTQSSFVGTRNIYLFGLNNAGTFTAPTGGDFLTIYGFRLYENGTLIRNMYPVYKISTSEYGMYDYVQGEFYGAANDKTFTTDYRYLVQVNETEGGEAFIKADGAGNVKQQYASYYNISALRSHLKTPVTFVAKPIKGFAFDHWEANGTFLSNENEFVYQPTENISVTAVFVPEVKEQKNLYKAIAMKYDIGIGSVYNSYRSASYLTILNGDVNEDLLQRSTSTFECLEVPSTVQINTPIFIYDPKGKIIYYGVIKAIDGNLLTCREPISLYDDDYLLTTSEYQSDYTTLRGLFLNELEPNDGNGADNVGFGFAVRKRNDLMPLWTGQAMPINKEGVPTKPMPIIDSNSVVNMEDMLLDAYSELGILMKYGFHKYSDTKFFMSVTPTMAVSDKIVINGMQEAISDVSINVQEADATAVRIYNSTGATFRGNAYMRNDGVIDIYESGASYSGINMLQYVGSSLLKQKVVTSDDGLKTVALQNLNGALYSHKITFTFAKNDLIRFDDLHLGQYVDFYYGNKLYKSVITAWSYTFDSENQINSMKITMGNVRTTLTAILNKRSKKK